MNNKIKFSLLEAKYFTLICMTLDHVAFVFLPPTSVLYFIFRMMGRTVMPFMCMFLADGFYYTSSRSKYFLRLSFAAAVSQIPYIAVFRSPSDVLSLRCLSCYNVMFTLMICFCILMLFFGRHKRYTFFYGVFSFLCSAGLLFLSLFCDNGCESLLWTAGFYKYRHNRRVFLFFIPGCLIRIFRISAADTLFTIAGFIIFIFLYFFYTDEKETNHIKRYFFYAYYPVHLAVIGFVRFLLH